MRERSAVKSNKENKLASLVATLVRNYDPACDSLTRVKSRATSVAKNCNVFGAGIEVI